jgi:cell division protease FtsH
MVMQYGMSSMGRINFKEDRSNPFLAAASGGGGMRQFSESTAQKIDEEVKRIIDEAIEAVREMLVVRKQALVALTERLIEVESLDSDDLQRIIDENSPGPLLVPGTDPAVRNEFRDDHKSSKDLDHRNEAQ